VRGGGGEVGRLAGLITGRSWVQILPPQLSTQEQNQPRGDGTSSRLVFCRSCFAPCCARPPLLPKRASLVVNCRRQGLERSDTTADIRFLLAGGKPHDPSRSRQNQRPDD